MTRQTPTARAHRSVLDRLFDPRSIAVVGASTDPAKRGYQVIRALQSSGYRHRLHAVNPRGGDVLGIRLLTSIDELPTGIDLALIALPAQAVGSAVRSLADRDVAGAVILANGFGASDADGSALESDLAAAIAETGIRVIGPNTSGLLNVHSGANLVGVPDVPPGPISVVAQSGNVLLSLLADDRAGHGPGFHICAGLGNQIDVDGAETITHFSTLHGTTAIAVHSEGFRDGRAFLVAAAEATTRRPLVLVRGGRSEAGQQAALSHTGSVASSDAVATAVLGQAGVELVTRSDELAALAGVLATTDHIAAGTGVAVLSDGGGHATLAVDALSAAGVDLAQLSAKTSDRLRALLGPIATVGNPIDVAGATDADPTLFASAVDVLMTDPAVGLVLIVGLYGGYHLRFDERLHDSEDNTSHQLLMIAKRHGKPLLVQSCYSADTPSTHQILRDGGVAVLSSIDVAVRAVAALYKRGKRLATAHLRSNLILPSPAAVPTGEGEILNEPTARRLVESFGVDTGPWLFAATAAEAAAAVAGFDVPCAVKVVAPQVVHKSDVGGVRLGVTAATAADTWNAIVDAVTSNIPDAQVDGVVVAPMARPGVELLVGATVDPVFGPIVAFGSGGVLVEALRDVSFRAAPFTHLEALELIDETSVSQLLDGHRHLPRIERNLVADFLVRIGEIAVSVPGLTELDLNPVIANETGLVALDVRVVGARSRS